MSSSFSGIPLPAIGQGANKIPISKLFQTILTDYSFGRIIKCVKER